MVSGRPECLLAGAIKILTIRSLVHNTPSSKCIPSGFPQCAHDENPHVRFLVDHSLCEVDRRGDAEEYAEENGGCQRGAVVPV